MGEIESIKVHTAGHSTEDILRAGVGQAKCGQIEDGVWFAHDADAGWVMSFNDLERIYLANKTWRERNGRR